ncbi:MAG: hypothetical protein ACXVV5_30355 [Solirubrobacteraceae bacterium]
MRMRTTTIGILGVSAIALAGCGSSKTFANRPRPPVPVNLTVYINNARVSVSPQAVGAGPIVFLVTNQAARAESLAIQRKGGAGTIANTGPINPQGTAQVTVNLRRGTYTVATTATGTTEAARSATSPIHSATLLIGRPRPSGSDQLLQP